MFQTTRNRCTTPSAHRRLLSSQDDDPLASVANLFDVAMVFAVALLLALVSRFHLPELLASQQQANVLKKTSELNLEVLQQQGKKLEHYQVSRQTLGGEGEKLGMAYRLKTGEVIYVPEQ